ncbi:MAG: hypothetical protein VX776_06120, partial [Planctomycetota bacterium]|nr:hypothetical protein [Planctomycetota bacterium]
TVVFQNLELRFLVPSEFRPNLHLFSIDDVARLGLRNTVITVVPPEGLEATTPGQVAVFNLEEEQRALNPVALVESTKLVTIDLSNTIIRGAVTLFHNPYQRSFAFSWDNGAFLSSDWLYRTAFTDSGPTNSKLSLSNVTAYCAPGLIYLQDETTGIRDPLQIVISESILVTDLGKPLILLEQEGYPSTVPFELLASTCSFDNTPVILEQRSKNDVSSGTQTTLEEFNTASPEEGLRTWYNFVDCDTNVAWVSSSGPNLEIPIHQQGLKGLTVDIGSSTLRGFDIKRLGELTFTK